MTATGSPKDPLACSTCGVRQAMGWVGRCAWRRSTLLAALPVQGATSSDDRHPLSFASVMVILDTLRPCSTAAP